jgi:hypothetical protein
MIFGLSQRPNFLRAGVIADKESLKIYNTVPPPNPLLKGGGKN